MAVMIMKKDQFAVLNYLGLNYMTKDFQEQGITMPATMKGWLLVKGKEVLAQVQRIVPTKKLLAGETSGDMAKLQIAAFEEAYDKIAKASYGQYFGGPTPGSPFTKGDVSEWDTKAPFEAGGNEYADIWKKDTEPVIDEVIENIPKKVKMHYEVKGGTLGEELEKFKNLEIVCTNNTILTCPITAIGTKDDWLGPMLSVATNVSKEQFTNYNKHMKDTPAPSQPVGVIEPEKNMNLEPVPLLQATKILQPVHSTSAGSKYYCVALGKDVNMAARMKTQTSVSIRIEGDIEKVKPLLSMVGVDLKDGYASMHLSTSDYPDAAKIVGSVIFGMGKTFHQTTTDITSLYGEGQ